MCCSSPYVSSMYVTRRVSNSVIGPPGPRAPQGLPASRDVDAACPRCGARGGSRRRAARSGPLRCSGLTPLPEGQSSDSCSERRSLEWLRPRSDVRRRSGLGCESALGAELGWASGSGEPGRGWGTTGVGGSVGVGTVAGLSGAPGVPGSGSTGVTGASGTAGVGGSVGVGTSRTGIAHRTRPLRERLPNGEEIEKGMGQSYPGLEVANPRPPRKLSIVAFEIVSSVERPGTSFSWIQRQTGRQAQINYASRPCGQLRSGYGSSSQATT